MNRSLYRLSIVFFFTLTASVYCCRNGTGTRSGEGSSGSFESPRDAGVVQAVTDVPTRAPESQDAGQLFAAPNTPMTESARQLFVEGSAAYSRRDFSAAARAYRQLYEQYPSLETAFNLARIYERMGEVADAIALYQRFLQSNPPPEQRTSIERSIAQLRAYEQRRAAGIAQAPATSAQLNQEGVTWFQRGVRFFQSNRYPQALQAFEEAARFLQTPELFYNLGMVHVRLHNYARAIEFLTQFADQSRGSAEEGMIRQQIEELQNMPQ